MLAGFCAKEMSWPIISFLWILNSKVCTSRENVYYNFADPHSITRSLPVNRTRTIAGCGITIIFYIEANRKQKRRSWTIRNRYSLPNYSKPWSERFLPWIQYCVCRDFLRSKMYDCDKSLKLMSPALIKRFLNSRLWVIFDLVKFTIYEASDWLTICSADGSVQNGSGPVKGHRKCIPLMREL